MSILSWNSSVYVILSSKGRLIHIVLYMVYIRILFITCIKERHTLDVQKLCLLYHITLRLLHSLVRVQKINIVIEPNKSVYIKE